MHAAGSMCTVDHSSVSISSCLHAICPGWQTSLLDVHECQDLPNARYAGAKLRRQSEPKIAFLVVGCFRRCGDAMHDTQRACRA
jgi:hypothetical protein